MLGMNKLYTCNDARLWLEYFLNYYPTSHGDPEVKAIGVNVYLKHVKAFEYVDKIWTCLHEVQCSTSSREPMPIQLASTNSGAVWRRVITLFTRRYMYIY